MQLLHEPRHLVSLPQKDHHDIRYNFCQCISCAVRKGIACTPDQCKFVVEICRPGLLVGWAASVQLSAGLDIKIFGGPD